MADARRKLDIVAEAGPIGSARAHDSAPKHVAGEALYIDDIAAPDGLLHAYLGGVGESAGVLLNATDAKGKAYVTCSKPMALNAGLVRDVLANGAPDSKRWAETAATPLIVSAMVSMAGCR